jgi:hypothetical protein
MTDPASQRSDVVVVVAPDRVTLVRALGRTLRPLVQVPIGPAHAPEALARVVALTLRAQTPRRVLLTVFDATPYERVAEPVIDACSSLAAAGSCTLVWLPDFGRIVDQARQVPARPSRTSALGRWLSAAHRSRTSRV